jgi:hypothetical protein
MAYTPTFNDWTAVAGTYGDATAQALQQKGIPLSQVGQYIGQQAPNTFYGPGGFMNQGPESGNVSVIQNNPVVTGPQGFQQTLSGLLQFGQGGAGGSGQQAQPQGIQPWPAGNQPGFQTSLLGAKALEAVGLNPSLTMEINPTPGMTPMGSQSGVAPVSSPTFYGIGRAPTPQTSVPSVFNAATPYNPTAPPPVMPTRQATGTGPERRPQPYATPPQAPQMNMPQIGAPPSAPTGPISGLSATATPPGAPILPAGIQNYTAGAFTTPPVNTGALPTSKRMETGGQVKGDTDTVPAMLTPGEYVIRAPAAAAIGQPALDQMNRVHAQGGGMIPNLAGFMTNTSVPGASPSFTNDPGAQSWAFNQLNPQEQATLQGGGTAAQPIQQKFNALLNQYQSGSGSPTPMSNQMPMKMPATATQVPVRGGAPAAPTGLPQAQQPGAGTLDQWLAQYGHTPQGQAYIGQNGNVAEVQRYLQGLVQNPNMTSYAPRAQFAGAPSSYGAAPRAELVGLPAGQGAAYDPKTYGINQTGPGSPGPTGSAVAGAAGAIGQIGQSMISNAQKALGSIQPARNAIPGPEEFKRNTPDIVLQGHQIGHPDVPGGYVLLAQPHDQNSGSQGNEPYLANNFGYQT